MEQEHAIVVDPYIVVMGLDPGRMDMNGVMVARLLGDGAVYVMDACTFDPPPDKDAWFDEICSQPWPQAPKIQAKELPYYRRFERKARAR